MDTEQGGGIGEQWGLVPNDTTILVLHTPPSNADYLSLTRKQRKRKQIHRVTHPIIIFCFTFEGTNGREQEIRKVRVLYITVILVL